MIGSRILGRKGVVFFFILLIIFSIVSIWGAMKVGSAIETYQKKLFTDRTETASLAIQAELVKNLTGTAQDTESDEYVSIKNTLRAIKKANSDSRFVYLMKKDSASNKFVFLVDAENEDSPDYSAPGDIYEETTAQEIESFLQKKILITKPTKDRWGTWVSGEVPILDPITSAPIALLGIDISADVWRSEIILAQLVVGIIALLVFCIFLIFYMILRKSEEKIHELSETNTVLATEKKNLTEAESIAGIGKWTLIPQSGEMIWNQKMYDIAEVEQNSKVNRDLLFNLIHPNDRENVFHILDKTIQSEKNECSLDYRIITPHNTQKNLLSLCRVYRKGDGSPNKVVCTTQDITTK